MSTTTFYPTMDGRVRYNSTGVVWATIIASGGTQTIVTETTLNWQLSGSTATGASSTFDVLGRPILVFDTSIIGDTDTISSATFSGYCTAKQDEMSVPPTMTIMGATLGIDTTINVDDYLNTFTNHQTAFATAKTYADLTTSAYNDFVLNASGIAAISKTGNTRLSLRFAQDVTGGTTPQQAVGNRDNLTVISSSEEADVAQDPKLTVTYAAAGGTIPLQRHTLLTMGVG